MADLGKYVLNKKAEIYQKLLVETLEEIEKKFVGNEEFTRDVILALIAGESILVKTPISSAKELFVKTLAESTKCTFQKITLTEDFELSDIPKNFANILLLENYKKAPKKVQAYFANLINEKGYYNNQEFVSLERPSLVIATYKEGEEFDEESLDKFMISSEIFVPDKYEEMEIIERQTKEKLVEIESLLNAKGIVDIQGFVKGVHMEEDFKEKVIDFIQDIRKTTHSVITPRTSIHLILAAKANAVLDKRGVLENQDIEAVLTKVLSHRIFEDNTIVLKEKFNQYF